MRLGSYRCEKCNGVALIDVTKLLPGALVQCPYCRNRYFANESTTRRPPSYSEMLPLPVAINVNRDFDKSTVRVRCRDAVIDEGDPESCFNCVRNVGAGCSAMQHHPQDAGYGEPYCDGYVRKQKKESKP